MAAISLRLVEGDMGLFYANLTVVDADRAELLAEVRRLKRTAFVSPMIDGMTAVFDKEMEDQDFELIESFGNALTKRLGCSALAAVLHDDDVLYLWLFSNGEVCDFYDSLPAYFDSEKEPGPPEGGDAEKLCKTFRCLDKCARVETLLRANLLEDELPDIPSEHDRHKAIACELGLPFVVAGVCYSGIEAGYVLPEFEGPDYAALKFDHT